MDGESLLYDVKDVEFSEYLTNKNVIKRLFFTLLQKTKLEAAGDIVFTIFPEDKKRGFPEGLTAYIPLKTSHITYHSFTEEDGFFLDVFTCTFIETGSVDAAIKSIFGKGKYHSIKIRRAV